MGAGREGKGGRRPKGKKAGKRGRKRGERGREEGETGWREGVLATRVCRRLHISSASDWYQEISC